MIYVRGLVLCSRTAPKSWFNDIQQQVCLTDHTVTVCKTIFFKHFPTSRVWRQVCACEHHTAQRKVRGQLSGVASLFLLHGPHGSNSSGRAECQEPLLTEPPAGPQICFSEGPEEDVGRFVVDRLCWCLSTMVVGDVSLS